MAEDVKPQRLKGPTPAGGAYALAYYYDANGKPCERAKAVRVEIHECDEDGEVIARTYGSPKAA